MMRFGMLFIIGVAVLSAVAAEPSPAEVFEKLSARAKANLKTPAGRAYDRVLSKHFEEHSGPALKECFDAAAKPDTSRFEMVFTIQKDGKLRDVSVWPETNISVCLRGKLTGASLPAPPSDAYLAYVDMTFQP